jgi:hypothetical protein
MFYPFQPHIYHDVALVDNGSPPALASEPFL